MGLGVELLLLKDRRWSSTGMVVELMGVLLLRLLSKGRRTARRRKEVVELEEAAHAQDVTRRLPGRQSMAWRPVCVCG